MGAPAGAVRRTTALRTGELAGGTASRGRAAGRGWANEKGAGQYRRRALCRRRTLFQFGCALFLAFQPGMTDGVQSGIELYGLVETLDDLRQLLAGAFQLLEALAEFQAALLDAGFALFQFGLAQVLLAAQLFEAFLLDLQYLGSPRALRSRASTLSASCCRAALRSARRRLLCSVSRSSAWRSSCRRLCHCRSCFSFSCNCRSFSCNCVWSDSSDSCCLSASCFCWLSCWAIPARSARVPCTSCSRCSVSLPISSAVSVSTWASSSGWRMTAAAWVGASLASASPSAPARRAGGTRRRSDRLGTLADTGSGAGAEAARGGARGHGGFLGGVWRRKVGAARGVGGVQRGVEQLRQVGKLLAKMTGVVDEGADGLGIRYLGGLLRIRRELGWRPTLGCCRFRLRPRLGLGAASVTVSSSAASGSSMAPPARPWPRPHRPRGGHRERRLRKGPHGRAAGRPRRVPRHPGRGRSHGDSKVTSFITHSRSSTRERCSSRREGRWPRPAGR